MFASLLFVKSIDYTLISHSIILWGLGGVFIVVLNFISLLPVDRLEVVGTLIVVGSSVIFISDSESTKATGHTDIFLGDWIALVSMPFFAYYLIFNANILKKLPAMIILHLLNAIQLIFYFVYFMFASDIGEFLSTDPVKGMFGWASSEYLLISLTLVGPIAGILGVGSYIFMLKYFPAHIVASIFLLEPITGQILGVILGQDNMPGFTTYFGATGIIVGLGLTIMGDQNKTKEEWRIKEVLELSGHSLL